MNALGIIFTDSFDTNMEEYVERRTLASLPYGGRYRLVDFPLSNMANAGVKNIGIITRMNYQSLAQHLRSGLDGSPTTETAVLSVPRLTVLGWPYRRAAHAAALMWTER